MSEYKPITGELRNSMTYDITTAPDGVSTASLDISAFCDLCDAIDSVHATLKAEHEKAMIRAGQLLDGAEKERDYNYANWQECKQKVLQGNITFNELNARIECLEDELSHCIELPKDMDGEYIHIGDVMEWPTTGETFEVVGIGDGTLFYAETEENGSSRIEWTSCVLKRHHHHDPTVVDVLHELVGKAQMLSCIDDEDKLVADFAKRLTLAGDAE